VRLSGARVWITACSLGVVLLAAVIETNRASPGPITAVHARVADLKQGEKCSACHGGWFSDMTHSCEKCHAPIAKEIEARKGLHGVLESTLAQSCASCHGEHHGDAFEIVNAKSFTFAGVADRDAFDHMKIGYELNGKHAEIRCADCHENADKAVLAENEARFLGLDRKCESCHVDPHEGRMRVDCAACHGQTTWQDLHSFGHEKRLPLVGGHGDVACRTCHAKTDAHALEILGESASPPPPRACADCHASPHQAAFTKGAAELASLEPSKGCVACHLAEHTDFGEASTETTAAQHALSGFALETPHADVACKACHAPDLVGFRARYPGRSSAACSACHADVHGGQFAKGRFAHQECTACHDKERFEPHAFTVEKHAATALPLTGKHVSTACDDCHERSSEKEPRIFHGTATRCELCHKDAHDGAFAATDTELRTDRRGTCAVCHGTTAFAEVAPAGFDHERWTGFAILGAHAQGECATCHRPSPTADATGRTFGKVAQRFGPYEGCVTCHDDVHEGAFDRPGLPAEVAGKTDCARCHEETSFRSLPRGFEHGRWTGFALAAEHEAADCSACHEPVRGAKPGERTWGKAAGSACSDCHVDPHAGQFAERTANDCARCHAAEQKRFLSFEHDRDSKFRLGPQHRDLSCDACHKPYPGKDGFDVVRYKPLGRECIDCHGVNEDVLMRRKRRRSG